MKKSQEAIIILGQSYQGFTWFASKIPGFVRLVIWVKKATSFSKRDWNLWRNLGSQVERWTPEDHIPDAWDQVDGYQKQAAQKETNIFYIKIYILSWWNAPCKTKQTSEIKQNERKETQLTWADVEFVFISFNNDITWGKTKSWFASRIDGTRITRVSEPMYSV